MHRSEAAAGPRDHFADAVRSSSIRPAGAAGGEVSKEYAWSRCWTTARDIFLRANGSEEPADTLARLMEEFHIAQREHQKQAQKKQLQGKSKPAPSTGDAQMVQRE